MEGTESTSKTRASFLANLARAGEDGMPMPFQVYFDLSGGVTLRYRTVEEVDAAVEVIGGTAIHDNHTHTDPAPDWHSYGNKYAGGLVSYWASTRVEVWAAIAGPAPAVES